MKINTIINTILIVFCCLTLPAIALASLSSAKAHRKAIVACEGKHAGDSVVFINKWKKRIEGVCLEKNGVLIAISANKLKGKTESGHEK